MKDERGRMTRFSAKTGQGHPSSFVKLRACEASLRPFGHPEKQRTDRRKRGDERKARAIVTQPVGERAGDEWPPDLADNHDHRRQAKNHAYRVAAEVVGAHGGDKRAAQSQPMPCTSADSTRMTGPAA